MLHIISEISGVDSVLLDRMEIGDRLLLIENAVVLALAQKNTTIDWIGVLQAHEVFVLQADLAIRGLASSILVDGFELIDYSGFVQLTVDDEVIYTWH